MRKIAFCTYVSDEFYHSIGCDRLVKSAAYFYPNIPMFVFNSERIENFHVRWGLLHPFVINEVLKDGYDFVVYFDADSIIAGPLDELFGVEDFDVIGVRNNNDYGKAGADAPILQDGSSVDEYMNCGLIATGNKKFIRYWMYSNLMYGYLLPFMEQTVFNVIKKNYRTVIIDPIESNVYYGVSGLFGEKTHWDSWKEIKVEGGELILNDKKVKVLHHAGGFCADKLQLWRFNKETRERLIEIT